MKNKLGTYLIIFIVIIAVILVLIFNFYQPKACTEEALICPDGSTVERVSPDCRFAPCPKCSCPEGFIQDGDSCNPKCFYSTPKCSAPSIQCELQE